MFSTKNNLVSFLMRKSLRVLTETTGMILNNLQKASGTTMTFFCKDCPLLVSPNIQSIGDNLMSQIGLF